MRILFTLLLFGLLLSPAARVHAISCAPPPADLAMQKSDTIFAGRAVSSVRQTDQLTNESHFFVTFSVLQAWRGVNAGTITIDATNPSSWTGGFDVGTETLVYSRPFR